VFRVRAADNSNNAMAFDYSTIFADYLN